MTFKFQGGDAIALKKEHTDFLPAGSRGTVLCRHPMVPIAYEVNFQDSAGDLFGAILYEEEIEPIREAVGAA